MSPAPLEKHSADLWGLADKYKAEVLQKYAVERRPRFVTEANVLSLVVCAAKHGAKDIKEFCLRFMVRHAKSISKQEEALKALPHNLLVEYAVAYGH